MKESLILAPIQWDIEMEILQASAQNATPQACPENKVFVPPTLREKLITEVHNKPSSGHPSSTATIHLIQNRYWWSSITKDVIKVVNNCSSSQMVKHCHHRPADLLQPLEIPRRPWSHIAIDFITDLPQSQGNTTILTVIDRFSKACRLIAIPKLPTALETAGLISEFVFRFYGLPKDIVSDRGPQFTSRLWSAFFKNPQVNVSLTFGYHPQSNGQTKHFNQEIGRFLRTYCHNNQAEWSKFLIWAEYAQNSLRKPSTGLTPFQCVLGFQPPLFPWSGEPSELPAVDSRFKKCEKVWNVLSCH